MKVRCIFMKSYSTNELTCQDEYRAFLKKYRVEYDEKYACD